MTYAVTVAIQVLKGNIEYRSCNIKSEKIKTNIKTISNQRKSEVSQKKNRTKQYPVNLKKDYFKKLEIWNFRPESTKSQTLNSKQIPILKS
ncbi:MAG: hypothetical protein GX638_18120 [Crenarchaeota archaeon]|nr:hypothetical protein [Thermoproteota archaeon]